MQRKLWQLKPLQKNEAAALSESCGIDPTLALLLVSRGITSDMEADMFLSGDLDFFDPSLIADLDIAVKRIKTALEQFQKIAIFGDYDCDGITSTAVLYRYLSSKGANVLYHIPDRQEEGYGISAKAVEALAAEGVQLIITVDNGISAFEACDKAKEKGVDMIVTDHHRILDKLPNALAVVDMHRKDCPSPYKEFSGVGVVFKLLTAMEDGNFLAVLEEYGDIIALGTVADIVPLTEENRLLVQYGLKKMNRQATVGIEALKEVCSLQDKEILASHLGFTLAPRINAAGRIGNPNDALQLLLCEDKALALELAQNLDTLNRQRQQMEGEILDEAIRLIEADDNIKYASVIVVANENWHPGILGIVAAKLVSRYGKPAIVISLNSETNEGTGSCRSIESFSIFDALCAVSEHLLRFGGHPGAAGLGIASDKIDLFREALDAYAKSMDMPFLSVQLDFKLNPASIQNTLLDTLSLLEPFGFQNPAPLFGLFHMQLVSAQPVGEGKHLRLTFQKGITEVSAMLFGQKLSEFPYCVGDEVDLAVHIERNEFRGVVKPSVHIQEIRFSGSDEENYLKSLRLYEKYRHGDKLSQKEAQFLLPNRQFLLGVYRFFQFSGPYYFDAESFCKRTGCKEALAARVLVSLDVLLELHLLEKVNGCYQLVMAQMHEKADLSDSAILKSLEEMGV